MKLESIFKYIIILSFLLSAFACSENTATSSAEQPPKKISVDEKVQTYERIRWDALLPEGYEPETIMRKYEDQLAILEDSDPKAIMLMDTIQKELETAPINEKLDKQKVQLAGFITPLENIDGKITEFLLVPYYGACIHVPPPPINQTVLIQMEEGTGLDVSNIYNPIWAVGDILVDGASTDLAQAGYRIVNASVVPYEG